MVVQQSNHKGVVETMTFDYEEERIFIEAEIRKSALILQRGFDVTEKSARDVVTSNDLAIEKSLATAIISKYPDDSLLTEEGEGTRSNGERCWVIDPIDGTTNYSRSIPMYGIQVALTVKGVSQLSLIYYVLMDEMYVARKGFGATCNGVPIHVGHESSLSKMILTMGDFSVTNMARNKKMLHLVEGLMDQAYKLRIHSSACIDLLFLASGKTDVHVMSANHPWDYLPGLLLVKEAGGIVDERILHSLDEKRTLMVIASTRALYDAVSEYI